MSKSSSRLVIAAFFGLLWISFVGMVFRWGQFNPADENRQFASRPRLDRDFGANLTLYVRDHFGFRGWLITLNGILRAGLFRTSTSPKVVIGRDGFLFFTGERSLDSYMGLNPITDCEIDSWVDLFERRAVWMQEHHIPFAFVLAPDKQTIYPELMPGGIPHAISSRADRIVEALKSRTHAPVIDLRGALTDAKRTHATYYLTDTHWSQWGAYSGYRELILQLSRTVDPQLAAKIGPPMESSQLVKGAVWQVGDLNILLGLGRVAPELKATYEPPGPVLRSFGIDDSLILGGSGGQTKPRLLFFRDSFGAILIPYVSLNFSQIYSPHNHAFDPGTILQQAPDLVLFEMVERYLNMPVPSDPIHAMHSAAESAVAPKVWAVLDEPANGADLSGAGARISGWSLASRPNAVEQIEVLVDGKKAGNMQLRLPHGGVAELFPAFQNSGAAGIAFPLDTTHFSNGRHSLTLKAKDNAGNVAEVDHRHFCVAN